MGTESYAKDKRAVVGWVATGIGGLALTIGGWAAGKLNAHETDIAVLKAQQAADRDSVREFKADMAKALDKLDRLLEKAGVRP